MGESDHSEPVEMLRQRLHRINDMVQSHEGKLGEHAVLIGVLSTQVEALRQTTASREQVAHASAMLAQQMSSIETSTKSKMDQIEASAAQLITSTEETLTTKIDYMIGKLDTKFDPILKAVYWAIGIVMTAVVVAVIGLVIRGSGGN